MFHLVRRILWGKLLAERQATTSNPFEPEITWLAIRSDSLQSVAHIVGCTPRQVLDWDDAIVLLSKNPSYIFIYGSVAGWILVLGMHSMYSRANLEAWSAEFGEVQYFEARAVRQYYQWAIFRDGVCTRLYRYEPETILDVVGEPTHIEKEFVLPLSIGDTTSTNFDHPNEYMLYEIAASWSIDPVAAYDSGVLNEKGWVCW